MLLNSYRFGGGGGGGPALWTPLDMAVVPQLYLDAEDSVVTDVSGFASAISNLGSLGVGGDFSQSVDAARPSILVGELNGKRVLSFDGAGGSMNASDAAARDQFRNSAAAWAMLVYKKRTTDASPTNRYVYYATIGPNIGARFSVQAGASTSGHQNWPRLSARRLDAQSAASLVWPVATSGAYSLQLHAVDYATRAGRIYVDGALVTENTALTTDAGLTSDTAANAVPVLGAFVGGSSGTDMDLAAFVSSNTYPSADDIDKLFGWAAHKYGLTASLPGGHPYKTAPPTV